MLYCDRIYEIGIGRLRGYSSVLERSGVLGCTRTYSDVLGRARAYFSALEVFERTRAYARVLGVQSLIAAAMDVQFSEHYFFVLP